MVGQSESPKERINVTYKPATGGASEELEVPFKLSILGDFNPDAEKVPLEERMPVGVNKNNFNNVLNQQNLGVEFATKDYLSGEEGAEINVNLKFSEMKDFLPEKVIYQVPETTKLMELRNALVALKGPLGNVRSFREAIEKAVKDDDERAKLLGELRINHENK